MMPLKFRASHLLLSGFLALPLTMAYGQQAEPLPGTVDMKEAPEARPAAESSPGLAFTTQTVNFGTIDEGAEAKVEFPFVNTSDKPIKITDLRTSCGCTAGNKDELIGRTFQPGEGDAVRATFNSRGRSGAQRKTITLMTDYERQPTVALNLAGDVVRKVELSDRTVNFGDVDANEGATQTIYLYDFEPDVEVKILNVSISPDNIPVETSVGEPEEYTEEGGRTGTRTPVTLTVPENSTAKRLAGNLTLRTDYADYPMFSALITGQISGDVEIIQNTLWFGVVSPGDSKTQALTMKVRPGKTFELTGYELTNTTFGTSQEVVDAEKIGFGLELVGEDTPTPRLRASVTAPDEIGAYRGTLVVKGNAAGAAQELTVPFSMVVREPYTTSAAPAPVEPNTSAP
ncbi:MAG: DUF1573 domain-containing protein [Sumerlaeia bacterium]